MVRAVNLAAAWRLVEQGKLILDAGVNSTLRSWKLPPSEFTASSPVTLRELLSHTAGITVHGFGGYAIDSPVLTLAQVLDGAPPANSAPIRNEAAPGVEWNYSGGGYTIMQQMMIDVTGKPFPDVMRDNVLGPLGMGRSSYQQPLPPAMAAGTAAGHYQNGSMVPGRWHVYPEMAAAGLWTTPSDLARFAIEVQRTYAGKSAKVVSPVMAKRMLTVQKGNWGLGLALFDTGTALRFNHSGRDEGFDTDMTATANTGQGAVIMINANDDSRMGGRIREFIATRYHWPNARTFTPLLPAATSATESALSVGGATFASVSGVTGGFHHFGSMPWSPARGLQSLQYVGAQNIEGRGIERHGSSVAKVLYYYRMVTATGTTMLLVYLTGNGDITDVDAVDG